MDSSFGTPSRRSYELPKPDTGLAEWTTKIKEIQRQVDADEEAEQRRLEEEIAAARRARLRRSRGGTGRAESADLSTSRERLGTLNNPADTSADDTPKLLSETQSDRETALRKLMDRNNVHNPDKTLTSLKSDSVPLAAFIGGRANGPRLNRHAPQVDVLDPTQYIQPDLSAPHPVFGTGGVAIPGMTSKTRESKIAVPVVGSEMSERYRPSSASALKSGSSPVVKREFGTPDESNSRRSFTSLSKYPTPALTQRNTEHYDTPVSNDIKDTPDLTKRKSNGSISKSWSLPSPTKESNPLFDSTGHRDSSAARKTGQTTRTLPHSYGRDATVSTFTTSATAKRSTGSLTAMSSYGAFSSSSPSTTSLKSNNNVSTPYRGGSTAPIPTYSLSRDGVSSSPGKNSTPLRRLMEKNSVYNPDKLASDTSRKSVAERAQTTSLAAFMGASGKGVRLTKHSPQVDTHDPTQFIQPDLSVPHPVFGKGGVAMPGMVSRKSNQDTIVEIDNTQLPKPSSTKKAVWPPVPTPEQAVSQGSISPQRTGGRARTISAPRPESSVGLSASQIGGRSSIRDFERSQSPKKEFIPLRDRTISTPSSASSFKQTIVTPSLARPLQPKAKTASLSPQIPTTIASPAFNKPGAQKDLTPSLSRLQGRGFVQNMVKASSQLSSIPSSPSPSPTQPAGKKVSVLDRWQQNIRSESPTKPLSATSSSVKSTTAGSLASSGAGSHSLKSIASSPSLTKPRPYPKEDLAPTEVPYQRSRTPGLGSATTMVVIKPSKSLTDLTELGMKTPDPESSPSRKTPIYPTEDSASKIQRNLDSPGVNAQPLTEQQPEEHIPAPRSAPAWMGTFDLRSEQTKPSSVKLEVTSHTMRDLITPLSPLAEFPEGQETPPPPKLDTPPAQSRDRIGLQFKHSRIPTTGKRLTVMEVAQALGDLPHEDEKEDVRIDTSAIAQEVTLSRYRGSSPQSQVEKRKSNYEKYSAIILPPLPEESTPTASPAGTLKNAPAPSPNSVLDDILVEEIEAEELASPDPSAEQKIHLPCDDDQSCVPIDDATLAELLKSKSPRHQQSPDLETISVEVFSIVGNSAALIAQTPDILYDTEILAVVHRVKSKASGLASTTVWCWLGRQTRLSDREDKKLQELSRRYGTSPKMVHQFAEPSELVQILGGRLAIRQGSRKHWTCDNTTMHLVRSSKDLVFIDEHDFNAKNMCSAFSYCFSILGSIYVWHGCGSTLEERRASLAYAKSLSAVDPVDPIELIEGENDNDEIFWMVLGEDEFAKADYWRWRHSYSDTDPRTWKIDVKNATNPVLFVEFLSMERDLHTSVYVMDCIWELFVLVGKNARGHRSDIRHALDIAKRISVEVASRRPYRPTVHVLVLPSQLPIDLRLAVRDLDEAWVNDGEVPDHMNLIPCSEADAHLARHTWDLVALKDRDMLPLGVDASALP